MKPDKAKELIKETFEQPFDKDRFVWFVKNLFPDKIEFRNKVYTGNYIKEAYRQYIRKYEQVGKFEDDEGNTIDLLAVELLKGQSVERARTSQRNFIAQYLKQKNHREGALVAFYSEGSDDWRFSFIKMEYSLEKKKDDLTPAKRFSFLVGKDEKSHTAQNQLTGLLTMQTVPLMQELEQAFNIETVTQEFFEKYKQLFLDLNDHIEKEIKKSKQLREELESRNIDSASFTKKLLGQIVFLYFLQKKGWLGVPKEENWGKGNKKFLRTLLVKAVTEKENFFSDYLVHLFYEALAKEHPDNYFAKLKCKIPFLNGGLFEADYNWEKISVDIPNKYFTNKNVTIQGDEGDGILDVFDRYNFTVKEDEPLDKEVAVDPEMLGKVFENLLEVKDRKSKGAFYTPREIVHYMCQESLIAYLNTALNGEASTFLKIGEDQTQLFGNNGKKGQLDLVAAVDTEIKVPKQDLEKFIREGISTIDNDARVIKEQRETETYSFQLPDSIREYAEDLDKALANIRICDPSIGSGAFPVGMMNEIVKAREILSNFLPDSKIKSHTPYELKRHTIQECIYGVDIDHSAIDIAKLRLWLSLVVDEEDFKKIKPLPNLDYKIICGSSIIGFPFKSTRYDATLKKLEKLKEEYFATTDLKEKKKLRTEIDGAIKPLYETSSKTLGYKIDFDVELAFSEVFHKKGGFDLFIGNPPYLEARSSEFTDELKDIIQKSIVGRWREHSKFITRGSDLLIYFLELGIYHINKNGLVVYITQNSWLDTEFGKKFQHFLLRQTNVKAIIDSDYKYFDGKHGPNINTVISIFQGKKGSAMNEIHFSRFHENFEKIPSSFFELTVEQQNKYATVKKFNYEEKILEDIKWGILLSATSEVLQLISNINERGKYLETLTAYNITIGQGLNLTKDYIISPKEIKTFPFLKKGLVPFLTSDDGAPFELSETNNFLADHSKFTSQEIKELKKEGILLIDTKSSKRVTPFLILPRGIGRHYCALNTCDAFSSSCVDVYDNSGKLPEEMKMNLWLFLNSSVCWLIREISGRKNLGGGMLKAEAIDLKSFPLYFDFQESSKIKSIYNRIKKREAVDTLLELEKREHQEIDEIVYSHLSIKKDEAKRLNETLYNLISERSKKSKT